MQSPRETRVVVEWGEKLWKVREDFPRTPETAAAVKVELDRLEAEGGGFSPEAVVKAAKATDSAMHAALEWSNRRAAEAWRLEQARELAHGLRQCVVVVYEDDEKSVEERTLAVPCYVNFSAPEGGRLYRSVGIVEAKPDFRAAMLAEALTELRRFQKRYNLLLEELGPVLAAIEATLERPPRPSPD